MVNKKKKELEKTDYEKGFQDGYEAGQKLIEKVIRSVLRTRPKSKQMQSLEAILFSE